MSCLLGHVKPCCILNFVGTEVSKLEGTCGLKWHLVKLGISC